MAFELCVVAQLPNVRPVSVHLEQIRHQVPLARDVFRFAGRAKDDFSVGHTDRLDVGEPTAGGQLLPAGPVDVHLVNVVIVLDIVPHRKDNLITVKADLWVPDNALGDVDNRIHFTTIGKIDGLHRAAAVEAVIGVSMYASDLHYAEGLCIRLSTHKNSNVRGNAVLGFGHLARRFAKLKASPAKGIIESALQDDSEYVRGQAWAAAEDVTCFLGWEIAGFDVEA